MKLAIFKPMKLPPHLVIIVYNEKVFIMGPRLVHNLSVSQGRYLEIVKAIEEEEKLCVPFYFFSSFWPLLCIFPIPKREENKE